MTFDAEKQVLKHLNDVGYFTTSGVIDLVQAAYDQGRADSSSDLLAALKEISKGEGEFSLDHMTHANNTIESMKAIAIAAIEKDQP